MNDNWQKVREIFDAAISRKPEERLNFVIEACGDDKNLLAEVKSLLSSLDDAESFLETPAVAKIAGVFEAETKELKRGKRFNHYEIIERLGAGGMGEVYLAKDEKLDRKVAVKILNEEFSRNESNLKRFAREAKAASALNHPNILVIHEIGESGDQPFFVSEYVQGKTLRESMRDKNLPLFEILDIAVQIAGALSAAHEINIIHRDIKPENVMIRPDGFVKILDFGLAKLVERKSKSFVGAEEKNARQTDTAQGVILGTINYMSPEQAKGERVDERADVFSFGILLYEMIADKKPFAGDSNSETLANLLKTEPPPLSNYAANVPEELQRIVSKTLNKNKDERYQMMKELLADLKDLRQDLEFQAKAERSAQPNINRIYSPGKNLFTRTEILEAKSTGANAVAISTKDGIAPPSTSAEYVVREIKQHKRTALAILSIVILTAIGFGYRFYLRRADSITSVNIKSIAVLPLKPINKAARDEIYEIGIADSLIQQLASVKNFIVRPLSAVRRYADSELDPLAAGREQQVEYVLASNYQIANGKIRVTSQLFNVENGQTEETYKTEKDLKDVFAVQDAVAAEVGNLLQSKFNVRQSAPAATRGTENEEAYRLYLQGVYFNDKRLPPDGEKAVDFFEKAVQIDPNYARAWAGVAYAHRSLMDIGANVDYQEQHRISMEAVGKALALDPNLSEAYTALCLNKLNYNHDFDSAETACRRAIELDPNSPLAHNTYARLLFSSGRKRFDEAISEIKTAIDLDPTSFYHQIVYTVALTYARRYDEATQQLERLAQRNQKRAVSYFWLVGGVAFQNKQAEDFERLSRFQKLAETDEETVRIYKTAYQTDGWQGILQRQAKRSFEYNPMFYFFGCLYAQIGDKDKAIEYLEKSLQRGEHWMAYIEVDPRFDSMRDDPRFQDLQRRVNLPL